MELNISDEKLEMLIEKEIRRYVRDRIERVMNDGKAGWFSQQNIEIITREVVMQKIPSESISQICSMLKTDKFIQEISDCIAGEIRDYLFE